MSKKLFVIIRTIVTLLVLFIGGYVLNRYEYIANFADVDNVVGVLPVAMVITSAIGITILLWIKYSKQILPFTISLSVLVVLSIILFPTALRGNWWISTTTSNETEATPDLSLYAPFSENSKIARLSEESTLQFIDNFPILDGATALYPVYAAFAEAVYDETVFSHDYVLCTNTRSAYEAIIAGERDVIFVATASEQQVAIAKTAGVDLHFTPIGREAFVFLAGVENPVDNITYQQLRNIYSGKTTFWNTLGWSEGGRIIAFQRPEGSGSQTGLQHIIMRNLPIQVPQPLPDASLLGTNSLMQQVSVEWNGVQPALGYSYRFFATTMFANPDVKLLKINDVDPSIENIQNGTYPFVGDFYAVTNGEPKENTKLLIDWILSKQGQELIEKTGYIPLLLFR
ncbi:MAG: substrate-binding domain-containing protein [Oscillospiraceae bacterium]|jgi:phosphate transport system substrate-binding protein|nr:substrate-binding domain-containing protein [Oscillospiraceae bacterium]